MACVDQLRCAVKPESLGDRSSFRLVGALGADDSFRPV